MYAPRSIANVSQTNIGATLPKPSCAGLKKSIYVILQKSGCAIATIASISTLITPAFAELAPDSAISPTLNAQAPEEPLPSPLPETLSEPLLAPAESSPAEDDFFSPENPISGPTDEEIEAEVGDIQPLPRPQQVQTPPQPNGQLLLRSSAFTSSNV